MISLMHRIRNAIGGLAAAAGWGLLGLSVLIVFESFARKFFAFSVQGADEIGGYVLAIAIAVGFSQALIDRAHIRIDLVHRKLPALGQAILNTLAYALLALFAGLLAWRAIAVALESASLRAKAPTMLQTSLVWPQGIWSALLAIFALLAIGSLVVMVWLIVTGRAKQAAARFGVSTVEEELAEELADVKRRIAEAERGR